MSVARSRHMLAAMLQSVITLGRVAQLGEQQPYKLRVTGSSPVPPTLFLFFTALRMEHRSLEILG